MVANHRQAFIEPSTLQAVNLGAGAAGVGTALTNVLRFTPVPTPSDGYIVVADDAANGMSFTLGAPGIWSAQLHLVATASVSLRSGLSLNDVTVANSAVGTAGCIAVGGPVTTLALAQAPVLISRTFRIADSAVGAVLRCNATDNAGATPVAAIVATAGVNWFALTRIVDAG